MEILDTYVDGRTYNNYFNIKYSITRTDIINTIIRKKKYKSYLEIGTSNYENYNGINIEFKECVDPLPGNYTYNMTSDEAFKHIIKKDNKYDIIFIDGLHVSTQVTKDIENSLLVLNTNGTIILHDCNPPTPMHASTLDLFHYDRYWNGDCYKSIIQFKFLNPTITTMVVNTDWGVGIIEPFNTIKNEEIDFSFTDTIDKNDDIVGGPLIVNEKKIPWNFFNKNRTKLLNLISVEEFLNFYK